MIWSPPSSLLATLCVCALVVVFDIEVSNVPPSFDNCFTFENKETRCGTVRVSPACCSSSDGSFFLLPATIGPSIKLLVVNIPLSMTWDADGLWDNFSPVLLVTTFGVPEVFAVVLLVLLLTKVVVPARGGRLCVLFLLVLLLLFLLFAVD